jgi:L-fuculose-phosphate aldolase
VTQPSIDQLLTRLSVAHAILSCNGHDDLTLGHMALRNPNGRGFWIKRADAGMRELTSPDDYQLLAFDGTVISGSGRQHSEWPIHAALLQSRPDLNITVHTHAELPTLLSAFSGGLRALTTDAAYLGKVASLALNQSHIDKLPLAAKLAQAFGQAHAILLANHGVVFAGRTIEHATLIGYYLVRAARAEWHARGMRAGSATTELQSVAGREAMMSNDRWLEDSFACLAGRLPSH